MSAPDIDSSIDRLDEALRAAGLAGLEPPGDLAALSEVADAVAPYVLPSELSRFWERVDADRVQVFTFPMLGSPTAAADLLRGLRELDLSVAIGVPPMLLPADYASHTYGVIELGSDVGEGGTIIEWGFDDFPVVAHSLADRLEVLAELISEGHFERGDGFVSLDHRAEYEKRLAHLDASGHHPLYGNLRTIPRALEAWPPHWLAASGIDLRSREPLGATHTIAALVAGAEAGRVTGRIHGTVKVLVGGDAGSRVVVEDDTGTLEVWCPAGTSPWGPVHRTRFELEIRLEGPLGPSPDIASPHSEITQHVLAGDIASAQDAALAFFEQFDRNRAAAVATDLRPLD